MAAPVSKAGKVLNAELRTPCSWWDKSPSFLSYSSHKACMWLYKSSLLGCVRLSWQVMLLVDRGGTEMRLVSLYVEVEVEDITLHMTFFLIFCVT